MVDKNDPRLFFVPIEKASVPSDGPIYHYKDRWWSHCPEQGLIFFKMRKNDPGSPQCNAQKSIAWHLQKRLYPWAETVFVPSVFVRIDQREFWK